MEFDVMSGGEAAAALLLIDLDAVRPYGDAESLSFEELQRAAFDSKLVVARLENGGFFLLELQERLSGRRTLFVLGAYSPDAETTAVGAEWLDSAAEAVGANEIAFESSRPGWLRAAPRMGFSVTPVRHYRKVVSGGETETASV